GGNLVAASSSTISRPGCAVDKFSGFGTFICNDVGGSAGSTVLGPNAQWVNATTLASQTTPISWVINGPNSFTVTDSALSAGALPTTLTVKNVGNITGGNYDDLFNITTAPGPIPTTGSLSGTLIGGGNIVGV